MRSSGLAIGVAAFVAFAGPAEVSRGFADDWTTCGQWSGDTSIAACTRIILNRATSASNRAIFYYDRGNAYFGKGQYDQAIADYDEAIKLNPKLAGAYANRGNAYENKGQDDQAIADYDEAIELKPKLV